MQIVKQILSIMLVIVIIVCLSAPCFAAAVMSADLALDLFGTIATVYFSYYGLETVLGDNNYNVTVETPVQAEARRQMYNDLFSEFRDTINDTQVTGVTVVDWATIYKAYLSTQQKNVNNPPPGDYDSVISLGLGSQLAEFFDKFADWICKDKLNLTRTASGFSHNSGKFSDNLADYQLEIMVPYYAGTDYAGNGLYVGYITASYSRNGSGYIYNRTSGQSVYPFYVGSKLYTCQKGQITGTSGLYCYNTYGTNYGAIDRVYINSSYDGLNYTVYTYKPSSSSQYADISTKASNITTFASKQAAVDYFSQYQPSDSDSTLKLLPKPDFKYKPINIPDPYTQDYAPSPLELPTNKPWLSTYEDASPADINQPFIDLITDTGTAISENTLTCPDSAPDSTSEIPTDVMPPFLPSQIPPLSFNFSGIWYYVVRWVNSCRAGLDFFGNVWSSIPPAMFFPVYGTAVACLVISVFRRFV